MQVLVIRVGHCKEKKLTYNYF